MSKQQIIATIFSMITIFISGISIGISIAKLFLR